MEPSILLVLKHAFTRKLPRRSVVLARSLPNLLLWRAADSNRRISVNGNGHANSNGNGHMNGHGDAKHNGTNGDVSVDVNGVEEMPSDDRGMVLPFSPITITFRDIHYFVPLPAVRPD